MKKFLFLTLVCALLLSALACGTENSPDETTLADSIACGNISEETTAIAYTGMEGTFYVYKEQWEDYISGSRDDYEIITTPTTATTPMETTADPVNILNELMQIPAVAVEFGGGKRTTPYQSLVCAHTDGGAVADGLLILQSTENVLGKWVSEGLIPTINLKKEVSLVNATSGAVITAPRTFRFYLEKDGVYSKAGSLENALLSDIYDYGRTHFMGESVYIRFDILTEIDGGSVQYAYIMRVDFYEGMEKADIFDYTATVKTASGESVEPYTSTVYFRQEGYVSDGALMFIPVEELLPEWIAAGDIPLVDIGADSEVTFSCGDDLEIIHSGKFRLYAQNADGSVTKIGEMFDSALSEIYHYGKYNLTGQRIYISYPFLVRSTMENGVEHDIMCFICVDFKEEIPHFAYFPDVTFCETENGTRITPFVQSTEAFYAHDAAGEYCVNENCTGMTIEQRLQYLLECQAAVMPTLFADLSYRMIINGEEIPLVFAVYNISGKILGEYKDLKTLESGDYYACIKISVDGKTFSLPNQNPWTEYFTWALWFKVKA